MNKYRFKGRLLHIIGSIDGVFRNCGTSYACCESAVLQHSNFEKNRVVLRNSKSVFDPLVRSLFSLPIFKILRTLFNKFERYRKKFN